MSLATMTTVRNHLCARRGVVEERGVEGWVISKRQTAKLISKSLSSWQLVKKSVIGQPLNLVQ